MSKHRATARAGTHPSLPFDMVMDEGPLEDRHQSGQGQPMRLCFDAETHRFFLVCSYKQRMVAKSAGFRWDPESKRWWTSSLEHAGKFAGFADDDARAALEERRVARHAAFEASRAGDAVVDVPLPDGCELLAFQRAGVAYAVGKPAVLIGDDMGLGKTVQATCLVNLDESVETVLVICPLSVKLNWKAELEKWLVRPMTIGLADARSWPDTQIVIVHPDVLSRHETELRDKVWDVVILDEAHLFKSTKAQRSHALFGYRTTPPVKARRKIALTGTPIPNRPVEIHPVLKWLDAGEWGNWMRFVQRYCAAKKTNYGWTVKGASHLDELQDRLRSTVMVRRRKDDVLSELPPKRRQILCLDPGEVEGAQAALDLERRAVEEGEEAVSKAAAAVELAKASEDPAAYGKAVAEMRQVNALAFAELGKARHETALVKAPYVADHVVSLLEGGVDKVGVWAHHRDVIGMLTERLGEFHPVSIVGGDSPEDRQTAIEAFQGDPERRVFLGSIQAAGVGITLTAASTAVFAELDWVPGNITQAEDRHHRIGQANTVLVQHVVLDESIDAKMAKTVLEKQKVIDAALDRSHPEQIIEAAPEAPVPIVERPVTRDVTRDCLSLLAERVRPEIAEVVHAALRTLVAYDSDLARERNGMGFSRADVAIGHALGTCSSLTPRQVALGAHLCRKYRGQLDEETVDMVASFLAEDGPGGSTGGAVAADGS